MFSKLERKIAFRYLGAKKTWIWFGYFMGVFDWYHVGGCNTDCCDVRYGWFS